MHFDDCKCVFVCGRKKTGENDDNKCSLTQARDRMKRRRRLLRYIHYTSSLSFAAIINGALLRLCSRPYIFPTGAIRVYYVRSLICAEATLLNAAWKGRIHKKEAWFTEWNIAAVFLPALHCSPLRMRSMGLPPPSLAPAPCKHAKKSVFMGGGRRMRKMSRRPSGRDGMDYKVMQIAQGREKRCPHCISTLVGLIQWVFGCTFQALEQ